MRIVYRPLESWPGELRTDDQRQASPFSVEWPKAVKDMERELVHVGVLDDDDVVVQLALGPGDFTLAGEPKAHALPDHPGVVLTFQSVFHGRMQFACDRYKGRAGHRQRESTWWRENLRAIVLTLEALRAVERYGAAERGEQYQGWNQLGDGTESSDDARALLLAEAGYAGGSWPELEDVQRSIVKAAMRAAHPDHGGSTDRLLAVTNAAQYLGLRKPVEESRAAIAI